MKRVLRERVATEDKLRVLLAFQKAAQDRGDTIHAMRLGEKIRKLTPRPEGRP